jgi:hypothetical protein
MVFLTAEGARDEYFQNELKVTPSDSVRAVQNQDGAVVLDIRQGQVAASGDESSDVSPS